MKIGSRIWKTAAGAAIATGAAESLDLMFYSAAGILAVICIEKTKQRSLSISLKRMAACALGLFISALFFETLGYTPWVLGLYVLCILPLLIKLGWTEGFVTSVVIILHPYMLQDVSAGVMMNEAMLIIIGVGTALMMNTYIPSSSKTLEKQQRAVEKSIQEILRQFALHLEQGDQKWDGQEFLALENHLAAAKTLSLEEQENAWLRRQKAQHRYDYLRMRETQAQILTRMLPLVSSLQENLPERQMLADFLYDLSQKVTPHNTVDRSLRNLSHQRAHLDTLPLPSTREELDDWAHLHHILYELRLYLHAKKTYFQQHPSGGGRQAEQAQ